MCRHTLCVSITIRVCLSWVCEAARRHVSVTVSYLTRKPVAVHQFLSWVQSVLRAIQREALSKMDAAWKKGPLMDMNLALPFITALLFRLDRYRAVT